MADDQCHTDCVSDDVVHDADAEQPVTLFGARDWQVQLPDPISVESCEWCGASH